MSQLEPALYATSPLPDAGFDETYILRFSEIDRSALTRVGGKGANLGEMTRAGFPVPPGFSVTTAAFRAFMAGVEDAASLFTALEALDPEDTERVRRTGEQVRARLAAAPIPDAVRDAVLEAWSDMGAQHAYAVRSSATAEDLPGASFAGQQDTYLNVRGRDALLQRVRDCWVSLFTDRAIAYRAKNGFDHRRVHLSVVVQRMVLPERSGILFTADPIDGRRHVVSIDAGFGLGEALVSGLVSADLYKVDTRSGTILEKRIADKRLAIRPLPEGGTFQETLPEAQRSAQVLEDDLVLRLAALGRRIEAHYGSPQDIEWCIDRGELFIVQSRPITTLFPIPQAPADRQGLRVFLSFGHAQVMTDAMPPLAQSVWKRLMPFGRTADGGSSVLLSAGGRLYVDPTDLLRLKPARSRVPRVMRIIDRLMADAVLQVAERPEFRRSPSRFSGHAVARTVLGVVAPVFGRVLKQLFLVSPEGAARRKLADIDRHVGEMKHQLAGAKSATERLQRATDLLERAFLGCAFPILPSIMAAMLSMQLLRWLMRGRGVEGDLDRFARGLEGNVTTEMDLALGDLADLAREVPAVVAHLKTADPKTALETARRVPGGDRFAEAASRFLERYGMRAGSEIDVTRPRWRDDPSALVQVLVGNLSRDEKGSHRAHHANIAREGRAAADRILDAAGWFRRPLVGRLVRVCRALMAVREHPKFMIVHVLDFVRTAALERADELVREGALETREDIWFLTLYEAREARAGDAKRLRTLVAQRRAEQDHYRKLSPPRVLTSEGESVVVHHAMTDLPPNALAGSAASAGVVEGTARVVLDPTRAVLEAGEILVAPFTDPGWTPLFINAAGLVMEVGGLMTHGSVVAREYGIPAVVCVPDATKRIVTGQRIRVNGDRGIVELIA